MSDSAGVSLLETILQKRANSQNSVLPTCTRLILALKRSIDISDEITASFFHQLQSFEPSATGMVLLNGPKSVLAVLECSPEAIMMILQQLSIDLLYTNNKNNGTTTTSIGNNTATNNNKSNLFYAFTDARIVCQIDDCPIHFFSRLFIESIDPLHGDGGDVTISPLMTPIAAMNEIEGEAPQIIASSLSKVIFSTCQHISELSSFEEQNEYIRKLPKSSSILSGTVYLNDERIAAIATASKLMTCKEWLQLFCDEYVPSTTSDATLPLPPKPIYA
jgi:hypothetical protein